MVQVSLEKLLPRLFAWLVCLDTYVRVQSSGMCSSDAEATEAFMLQFLAQLSPQTFFDTYWSQKPVLLAGHDLGHNYSHLFSLVEWEELITRNSASSRRLQKDTPILHKRHFKVLGCSDEKSKHELNASLTGPLTLLHEGCTIVINRMEWFWRPVQEFISTLEYYFELPVTSNLYMTAPGFMGNLLHWDDHPVFFLQISGEKRWKVWAPFVEAPTFPSDAGTFPRSNDEVKTWKQMQQIVLEVMLRPGDVIYIPRGYLHEGAVPSNATAESVHLTIAPDKSTWMEFLQSTPLLHFSGQSMSLKSPQHTPAANYTPSPEFVKQVTHSLPLALRRELPPRLSHLCQTKKFEQLVLDRLWELDTEVPKSHISETLKSGLATLGDGGELESCCSYYLVYRMAAFVSPKLPEIADKMPEFSSLGLECTYCVRSPAQLLNYSLF